MPQQELQQIEKVIHVRARKEGKKLRGNELLSTIGTQKSIVKAKTLLVFTNASATLIAAPNGCTKPDDSPVIAWTCRRTNILFTYFANNYHSFAILT